MESKQQILSMLKAAGDVVSGETLSAAAGVSRVAIWKHVKALTLSGIPIQATSKGYRLVRDPDSLWPWEFDTRQDRIRFFQETPSTMDEATALARRDCPSFTVVVAQRQTRGRGRLQRTWLSGDGGLYFTVVVRPEITLMQAGLVNLAAAIDMADVLRAQYGVDARLKWPNDILVDHRKICGVLSQMEVEGDQLRYLTIGLGLNVNNGPEIEMPAAVSLEGLLARKVPRRPILTAFLDRFERRMAAFDSDVVIDQWRANTVTLGQPVCVVTIKKRIEGMAVDVDRYGGLTLQLANGSYQTVRVGDCFHRQ
jgi:BirA family biotin operon repressor/biotin-[acetyl-CoA-carboxylase] ligase